MTNTNVIYFFEYESRKTGARSYGARHETDGGESARTVLDVSLEYLSGFLDGVTSKRWNQVKLVPSLPQRLHSAIMEEGRHPTAISREDLGTILKNTELNLFYDDL